MAKIRVAVRAEPIDIGAETAALTAGRLDLGAVVTFTGLCRDEGGRLAALELEHYPGMAEAEIERIAEQAVARFDVAAISVVHRHGRVIPGETIVVVATASTHRHAAFEAASFIMDYLKTHAPFWKKEHLVEGGGAWIEAKARDEDAEARWTAPPTG